MIDLSYIFALVSFYLVMYITPGPNNAMILASGVKFGFIKTIPVILGITIGHNFQLLLVCFGFGKIFQIYPVIQFFLKILCATYLTYLSYKILGSFNEIKEKNEKPIKFYEAAFFQIINPKAWSISSMSASGFILSEINLIYSIMIIFCLYSAIKNKNRFGSLLTIGLSTIFFSYFFVNIAAVTGMAPVTGVPLPLISYGGSAMLVVLGIFGLIQSAHVHRLIKRE